jgi:isoleucyl-tRNA synthetase
MVTSGDVWLNKEITPELRREGLAREVVRHVQSARKNAGLNVDDRISLSLSANEAELEKALEEYKDTIATETLAESSTNDTFEHVSEVTIEGASLTVSLQKK